MDVPDSFFPYQWWIEVETAIEWSTDFSLRTMLFEEAEKSLLNDVEARYGKEAKSKLWWNGIEDYYLFTKELTWDSENFYVMIDRRTK